MHFSGFKKHTEALSTINQLVDIIRESEAACDSSSILKALASSDTWLPPLETCRLCDEEFRTYINVITVICQILLSRRSKVDWRRSEDGIIVRQIVDFIVAHSADALQKLTWAPEQAELMKCLTMLCGDENGNSEIHWKKLSTDHPLPSRVLYFLNDYESKQQFTLDSSMAEVPFTGSFLQMPSDGINLNWSSAFTSLRTPTPLNAGSHTKVNIAYAIDCVVRLNDLSRVTLLLTTNTLYSRLGSQSVDTNTDTSNAMQSATASFLEFLNATPAFVNANLDITLSFVCSALRLCFVRQFEYDAYSFDTTQNVFKCIKCLTDNLNDIYNRTFPMNAKLIEGVNVPPHVRNFLVIATAMQGLGSDTYKDLHKIETVVSMSSLHAVYERLHYLNDTMRLFTELIITAFAYNDEGIDSEGGIGISSDGVKREGDFDVGVTELWTVPQTTIMSAMQSALFILREFNARTRWATLARSLLYSANNIAYEVERLRDTNPSKQRTVGMGSCGSTTVDEYDISEEAFEELFSDQTTPMQSADIDVLESELKDQVKFATEAIACANVAVHADNFLRLNTGEEFFQCVLEIVRIDRCQSTSCLLRELLEPIRNHVRSIMSILWSRHSHFSPSDKTTALTMIELLNGCNHTNEILPIAVRSDASTPVNSPDPFGFVTLPQSSLDASLIAFAMNSLIDPVTVVPSTEYVGVATRLWELYLNPTRDASSYTATYALPRLRSIQFNAHSCLSYNNAIISTCINVDVENRWQALWLREHYVKIMTVWPYKVTAINVANHKQSLKSVAEIIVHGVTTTMREGERRQMPVNGEHENENRSTSARMVSWMDQTYLLEGCLSAALSLIAVEDLGECKDIATTLVRVLHLCHSLYNELNTPSRKDRQAQVENTLTDVQNVEQIVAFLDYACELVSDKELYAQAPLLYAVLYLVNTAVAHLMEKTLCSEHDRLTRSLSSGLNAIVRLSGRLVDVCVSKICERSCEKTESVALKHLIRSGATFASCSAYIECLGGETSSLYSLANATRNSVVQHSTDTGIAIKRRKSSSTADVAELAIEREASTMNVKRSATRSSDVDTSTAESTAHKHTCTHTHSPSHAHMHMLDLTKSTVSVNDGSGYVIQHVVAQIGSLLNSLTSPHMDEDHDTPPHMEEDDGTSVGTQTHLNATLRSIQILQSLCARILKVQSKSGLLSAIVFSLCDVVESVCVKNALVMSSCCEGVGDSMLTAFVPSHSKRVRMLAHARAQSLSKFLTTLHYENTDDTWSGGVQVCVPVANAVHMNARKNIITHVVGETETHASSAEGELVPLSIGVTNLIWEECIRLYTHFVILVQDCNSGSHTHEDSVAYSSDNASKAARCEEGNDTMFVREMIKYLFATRNLSAMRALPPITYTSACVFTSNPLVSPVVLDLIVSSEFQPTLSAFLKHTLYENVAEGYGASDNLSEILPDRKFKATGTRSFMGFGAPTYTSTVDMCRDWVTALNAIANTSSSTSAAADVIVNTLSSVFVDVETNREHFRNEDRRRLSATVSAVKALELLSDVCMASNRVDQLARVLLVAIKHHLHVDVDWDAGAADIKPHTQAEVVNHNIPSNGRNIHTQTNKCATICDGIGKNGINESVLAERLLLFVFDIVSQYHTTARADGHDGLKNMEYQSDKGKGKELPTSTNSTMKDDLVSIARSTPLPTASPAPPSLSPTPTSAPASCTPTTETDILDKEVCTFVSTGEQFTEQHWYFCYTCRLVKSEGCCSVCVQVCHPGHDVEYARFSRFFCDCGASGKKRRCSARTPRKRLSANNKNVGGTLAEGGRTTFSEDACDSYTHTSTRSRSPLMHLDKYIDNYNSVCNTVETGTDGTRLNPYSECTHAQMHACVTVLRNGGVFEKVWEFVSRHGDAIVSRPRDKRKFPDDESTLPWLPAYSTKSGAIEPVKLKRSAKGQPKPRPKFTFHTQALAVIPVTSTSSYLVCGLKSFITIAIADSHSKVLQDSHNENEPSGSERSESHLDTLHKYPVDFDVLFVARNLVRLSHVAIGGASACVVMTLDVTGGSLKKCLDVSVGLDVYDDAYIIDVQWLPGSQVMLAITTTHFVKVFDMSRDTIAPVFFHSISEYGSKCNETIVSSTFIPPKPNTCAHFRTNAHTNQDHPSTTESSIHSIGINADKSRNNLDVGESRSAFESVRLVENINTYGYSSRECMYLIVSTSIGALYGLSVGNRKETNFGTHSHKTIAKPICLPLLPSTLHGQSGIVEYMILARKLVVAYNDVCLISDFDTELECLVAFHWIKYSTLTPTLMHTSSSTSMPSANAQLKANSPKLRHVIPIHSTRDLAILTFEPSTKHGDNVKSKSSTASTSGPPLCLCLSVTEMRVVSRLDIPAIGLVGCSSSAVSMFDTSTGDDYRRYVLTMYEDGSFRRFDLPIRLLTKESDKFTVYTMNQWEPLRRGGVEAKMEALFCTPAPVTFFEDVVCVTPETNFSGPNLTQNYYNQDEIRSRLMNPKEFLTSAVRNTFDIDIRINKKRNHMVVVGIRVLLGNKSFSGLPSELVVLGRSHKVRENCNRWYSIPFTLSEVRQSALIDTITLSARKPFTKGKFIVIDSVEVYALPRTCISRLIGPSAVGISSSCSDKTLRTNGKDVQISPLASLYLGLRVLQLACLPMPTSTKSKTPMLGSTFKVLLSSELPVIAQLSSSVHIRRTAYSLLSSIFLNNEKSDVDKICDQALVRIAEQEAVKLREATATRIDKITDGFVFERLVLCLHSVSQRDPGVIDAHLNVLEWVVRVYSQFASDMAHCENVAGCHVRAFHCHERLVVALGEMLLHTMQYTNVDSIKSACEMAADLLLSTGPRTQAILANVLCNISLPHATAPTVIPKYAPSSSPTISRMSGEHDREGGADDSENVGVSKDVCRVGMTHLAYALIKLFPIVNMDVGNGSDYLAYMMVLYKSAVISEDPVVLDHIVNKCSDVIGTTHTHLHVRSNRTERILLCVVLLHKLACSSAPRAVKCAVRRGLVARGMLGWLSVALNYIAEEVWVKTNYSDLNRSTELLREHVSSQKIAAAFLSAEPNPDSIGMHPPSSTTGVDGTEISLEQQSQSDCIKNMQAASNVRRDGNNSSDSAIDVEGDAFALFPQLLTTHLLLLGQSLNKEFASTSEAVYSTATCMDTSVGVNSYVDLSTTLCILLNTPTRIPSPLRQQCKGLHYSINGGDKSKSYTQRDGYVYDKLIAHLREYVSVTPARKHPHDASTRSPLRTASYADVVNLRKLFTGAIVCCKLRPEYWQAYCARPNTGPKVLEFLGQCVFMLDADVRQMHVSLILRTVYTSEPKAKPKADEDNRPKCTAAPQAIPLTKAISRNVRTMVNWLLHNEEGTSSTSLPTRLQHFILSFALCVSGTISDRTNACKFLKCLWQGCESEQQQTMLDCGLTIWAEGEVARVGEKGTEFTHLLCWCLSDLDIRSQLLESKQKSISQRILAPLRTAVSRTRAHPNGHIYQQLSKLFDIQGYYLEKDVCDVCSGSETITTPTPSPLSENSRSTQTQALPGPIGGESTVSTWVSEKLGSASHMSKFTDNAQLHKLRKVQSIGGISLRIKDSHTTGSDRRRPKRLVKTINVYYTDIRSTPLGELKGKFSIWHKICSIDIAPAQRTAHVQFEVAVVTNNIMIEYMSFHTVADTSSSADKMDFCVTSAGFADTRALNTRSIAPSRTPDIIGAPHATVVEQPALPHQRIGLSMFDNSATARLSEMDPFLTSHERARGVNQETPKGSLYAHTRAPRLTSVSQLTKVIQKFYNSQCKSNADSMSHSLRLAMTTNQAICLWRDSTSSVTGGTFSGKEYVNTSTSTGMHISAQLSAKSSSRVSHPGTSWTTMMPTSPCYGCTHHFINNVLCLLEQFLHATSGTGTSDVYESEGGNTSDQDKLGTHGSNSTVRLWVTLMRMDVVPLLYDCMSMDDSGVSWLAKRVLQTYLCRSARDNDGDKVQESVLALAKDASHIVCDRITQAIDFVFSHPNLSSDMIMAVSHREVALLCQLCSDPSNTLFEPYLRILIIYFFRGVGAGMGESNDDITLISPVLPHRTQRAAFAELVLLPLLKVLNRTCTWIDADVKEDECDDVLSQKRTQTLQQPHTQTNHNMHVMDEECCREYQNMYITADLDEWLADGNGVSYKAWANAQPKYTKECQRVHADGGTVSHDGVGNRMGSFDCPLSALFTNTAWLRFLLFCPSSISVRKETSKLIHQLCSGENRQHSFVLFLESCLANVGEQGAYADEYRVLFKDVVKSEETKRLLASKGLLELLLDLILTEIKGLSAGNTFTVHGLTQGLALKFYIEILVGHLEVTTVQQQFKSEHLVGRLLDAYLYLRGVPRPNCTKLTNDCAELMRSLLETLTSGTIEETQSYMAACIQSLDRFSQTDVQRPVFILEQLCNIVCPISVEPEILLILRKSRSQEEFIRGRMTRNPYNSSEIGPTMRDAKNKICVDLELLGLLDDDFGMELLVDGSIIGLDLPIRQVYERVWLKSAHPNTGLRLELGLGEGWEILGNSANLYVDDQNDNIEESEDSGSHRTPMEIVFRLQGLDGEATEEMISSFPEDDAKAGIDNDYDTDEGEYDAVSEHEETYAFTSVIGTCGGLQVLTKCLYGVEDFHAHSQMVDLLTRLLKACLIKSNVDLILAQQDVDTVSCLLKAITTAVAQGVDGDVIYRLICIVHVLLSKINTDDMRKRCLTHTTTPNVADKGIGENCRERDLELVLNMVCDAKLFRTVKIYRATSRILPLLTYSSAKLRETLVDRFMPYLEFSRLDVLGDDAESPLSRHHRLCLDCFCQMNMSLSRNKNKCSSRSATVCVSVNEDVNSNDDTNCMNPDACIRTQTLQETRKAIALLMVLDKRIPQRTLAYIVTQLPDGTTPFSTESEEWNVYLTRPALPYALRVLAAMCRMSSLVQTAVREAGGVGVLHRLEHVHSGIYNIGSLAENVLDVCMDVDSVREEVESMRAETRRQKRTLALLKRQRVLASMGLKVENTVPSHSSLIVTQPSDTRNEPSMDDLNKSILHHTPNNAPVIKAVSPTNVSGIDSLTEEDSGHTCIVCREGYHFKATSVLGIYTYTRRATRLTLGTARVSSSSAASTSENVALMSMGAPRERGDIGVLSGGTGVLGNTSNRCYTTVTSFNVIHTECHTEAALADRTASRGRATVGGYGGPRGEWDGAVLRNSDAKCNNLLPILGPETALSSYGKWVDKYFDGLEKCGRILHSGRVSLLVSDMTQLLIRYSLQISLNKESGGGSRQSNIVLIPYMTQMALFLMDHKGGSERSKITQQYNEYLSTCLTSVTSSESTCSTTSNSTTDTSSRSNSGVVIDSNLLLDNMVESLFIVSVDEWQTHRLRFLAQIIYNSTSPTSTSTSHAESMTSVMCSKESVKASFSAGVRSSVIMWCLVDRLHSILTPICISSAGGENMSTSVSSADAKDKSNSTIKKNADTTTQNTPEWAVQLFTTLRLKDLEVVQKCRKLIEEFGDWFPSESLQDLLISTDHLSLVMDNSPIVSAWL
eukprot:CFRG5766T1